MSRAEMRGSVRDSGPSRFTVKRAADFRLRLEKRCGEVTDVEVDCVSLCAAASRCSETVAAAFPCGATSVEPRAGESRRTSLDWMVERMLLSETGVRVMRGVGV